MHGNLDLLASYGAGMTKWVIDIKGRGMSYVLMRWYVYMWQRMTGSCVSYYVRASDYGVQVGLLLGGYQTRAWRVMRFFLKRRRVTQRVMLLLVLGLVRRDVSFVVECVRKMILCVRGDAHRYFMFVLQGFMSQIFEATSVYSGLRSYRLEVVGKFGRGGLRRTRRYILASSRGRGLGRTYVYSHKLARLTSGVMGIRGLFRY